MQKEGLESKLGCSGSGWERTPSFMRCLGLGKEVVMVIANNVHSDDGGCVGIISSDVGHSGGSKRLGMVSVDSVDTAAHCRMLFG